MLLRCILFAALWGCFSARLAKKVEPNYQACNNKLAMSFPYCNTSLSFSARVQDLVGRLTLKEKISLISAWPKYDTCPVIINPIERIGLPGYMWLVETNTGVSSACVGPDKCATTFIGPGGLGASFNRSSWWAKGDVISSELRAFSNINWYRGIGSHPYKFYKIGFDGFGPNINIVRDPRFGRNSELPSEDPMLSGTYASKYVQGIQQVSSNGYYKMLSYAKHYDAYSVETDRAHFDAKISTFDFWDTYLAQYELIFTEGKVSGAMCSYASENGRPSCANSFLLNEVVRKKLNRPDAVFMTDCGALNNMVTGPPLKVSPEEAAAFSINNGTDIDAGDSIWYSHLESAVQNGLTSEAVIDKSLSRSMMQLFLAGRFDPPSSVPWTSITEEVINSTAHQRVNYEAAEQSFVLLRNNDDILPMKEGKKIAVLGPQAVQQFGLLSDYYGDMVCWEPHERANNKTWDCIPTIGDQIAALNNKGGGSTSIAKGVDINSSNSSGIAAAVGLAKEADVVVLVLGIDRTIEHEGIDRKTTTLPGLQDEFAAKVLAVGKPTVLVLVNGGILSIDSLKHSRVDAIVEAFYPSTQGAKALANVLFGHSSRAWGRLPVTIYPKDYINQISLTDFDMSKPPGRTYRYYTGQALWPFGHGLTYAKFDQKCSVSGQGVEFNVQCEITNVGSVSGDEVVMVYHFVSGAIRKYCKDKHPVPLKQLVAFERIHLVPKQSTTVNFFIGEKELSLTTKDGARKVYSGTHFINVWNGNTNTNPLSLSVESP